MKQETFCSIKAQGANNDETCDVLLDLEIPALSFVHIIVTPKEKSEQQAVPAETAFKAFNQVRMNNDVKVSIKDAAIGVKKLSHGLDPLQFSIRHSNSSPEQLFTFSVETV